VEPDVTERDVRIEILGRLDADEVRSVALLVERATEADGVRPLSEHVVLHLRHGGDERVRHVMAYATGPDGARLLAGYAHLDVTDAVEGSSGELVVDPGCRRRGVGHALARQVLAESPDGRLRLWSHGGHPAAAALAASLGLTRVRTLLQMRRSLFAPLPQPTLPNGVRVRTFEPGADDAAWVDLNARAFAGHPEQGRWTVSDLRRRMAEPWFDPSGFFLAERDTRLVGFHWTKVHGGRVHATADGGSHVHGHDSPGPHSHDGHGHDPVGEVYVVAVDTDERGQGLGRALTLIGLRHLRGLGLPEAMLYVDADATTAIALYRSLGFATWDTDVMFRRLG